VTETSSVKTRMVLGRYGCLTRWQLRRVGGVSGRGTPLRRATLQHSTAQHTTLSCLSQSALEIAVSKSISFGSL
jgi:hypothetical protein